MTTKKADKTQSGQKLERGRFARLLAAGYTVEVTPSPERKPGNQPKATGSPSRPSKASDG